MAAEDNKQKGTTGDGGTTPTTGSTGTANIGGQAAGQAKSTSGGQQISGEQIFTTTEENTGGESFATTGAGTTGGTGGEQANLSDAVSDAVSGDTSKAKEMLNQAKEATGKVASQAFGQVQEKASTVVDTKTSDFARGLTTIAGSMRQFTENLRTSNQEAPIAQTAADYGESLTNQIEELAGYLDRADLNQLSRDIQSFARRNPAIFLGGAFALGIVVARFIKSGSTSSVSRGSRRQISTGEPPPLGRTLPSVDNPTTNTGTTGINTTSTDFGTP